MIKQDALKLCFHVLLLFALQAISIEGDEVFSFSMSLTPNDTEGVGYADTCKSDGSVKLTVGCIRLVYLHKFIMSLLVSLTAGRRKDLLLVLLSALST